MKTLIGPTSDGSYVDLRQDIRTITKEALAPTLAAEFAADLHTLYEEAVGGRQRPTDGWRDSFDYWLHYQSEAVADALKQKAKAEYYEREFRLLASIIDPWSKPDSPMGYVFLERLIGNKLAELSPPDVSQVSVHFRENRGLPIF